MSLDTEAPSQPEVSFIDPTLVESIYNGAAKRIVERHHIPVSTYRLQFNRFFTFEQARKLVDYFEQLGISDLYASPYFKARAESLHGYDIASHNELNPSIGGEKDYDRMVEALHKRGMFQILDTVPNHMGIGEEGNAWWMDVLENGRSSVYSSFFDIDWNPLNNKITNKVLLPILGDQYGTVLESGELKVDFIADQGRFVLRYWDTTLPIDPRTYSDILDIDRDRLVEELGSDSEAALEYQSVLTAISHLPENNTDDPAAAAERNREKEIIKRRLVALCASEPRVLEQIERNVQAINGTAGDPHSFDRLDALLEKQPYRLSFWRVATEEINYRRFFDVNDLAAIRVDDPRVFEETHRMIMRFLREGKLNGLRIDHVDGLLDPAGYFQALQHAYFLEICRQVMDEQDRPLEAADRAELEAMLVGRFDAERTDPRSPLARPLYIIVEKILGRGESLPGDWAVYGTTGYEFTNLANGLFVDGANQKAFDEIYASFTGEQTKFADMVYESKLQIMRLALASEVTMLTNMLSRITEADRHSRDFTVNAIRMAIREVIACFPVYRTYVSPESREVSKTDRQFVERAIADAKRRNPATDPSIFDFIGDVLRLKGFDEMPDEQARARRDFVLKFQQVTGPVIAKGLEDTAFYNYNRLISLNEVGGEPELFGVSLANFHKLQADRQRGWPHSMLTTSTHDTKRSEDVRLRIDVLSEMPKEWRTTVRRWARMNRKLKRNVEGQLAPSPNEEYFLYQTLVGVWPFVGVQGSSRDGGAGVSPGLPLYLSQVSEKEHAGLIERLQTYMRKALNEAKVNSSWVHQNEPYLSAVSDFVAAILRRDDSNRFLADFIPFQQRIAHHGTFNSLSQVLLKITGPGMPDIYQGNEIWDLSLVDPDNRRPVDYDLRRKMLKEVERAGSPEDAESMVANKEDGLIKLLVTSRALRFRRDNRDLFEQGNYVPLQEVGKYAENIVAYARTLGERSAVVIAPRLVTRLGKAGELTTPVGQAWAGGRLPVPGLSAGQKLRNVLTGEIVEAREQNGAVGIMLEEALATVPAALLGRTDR